MKKLLMIASVVVLAAACDKNQKAVKKIDGSWNATSYVETWGGTTEDYIADGLVFKMDFDNCKLKDDEFCRVTITQIDDGDTYVEIMDYRVAGYGTSLELREPGYPSDLIYFKIVECTKDTLVLELDYGDGDISTITLAKES